MVKRQCTFEGCDDDYFSKGYCVKHYRRYTRYGDPSAGKFERNPKIPKLCTHESGCRELHFAKGFCEKHYRANYRKVTGKR